MICGGCRDAKRCVEDFANEPIEIGGTEINVCPLAYVGDDLPAVNRILDAATFADRGHWPTSGGWGDQTAACIDGINAAWAIRAELEDRARNGKPL